MRRRTISPCSRTANIPGGLGEALPLSIITISPGETVGHISSPATDTSSTSGSTEAIGNLDVVKRFLDRDADLPFGELGGRDTKSIGVMFRASAILFIQSVVMRRTPFSR